MLHHTKLRKNASHRKFHISLPSGKVYFLLQNRLENFSDYSIHQGSGHIYGDNSRIFFRYTKTDFFLALLNNSGFNKSDVILSGEGSNSGIKCLDGI